MKPGGCERSLADLLCHMDFSKYDVDLLLFEDIGPYAQELPDEVGVIFYDITKAFGSYMACIKRAVRHRDGFTFVLRNAILLEKLFGGKSLRLCRFLFKRLQKRYDCVIAYRSGFCTDFAAYAVKAGQKISWWHHGALDMGEKSQKNLQRAYRKMDCVVVVSEGCRLFLENAFPDLKEKFITIPNLVDKREIEKKAGLYQPKADISGRFLNLVSVGRLSPEKNMLVCPQVCKLLKERGYKVKWYIVGGGAQEKELKDQICKYALQAEIVCTGSLQNPYPYINAADIYVHPSLVESQGLSILEAMALEKPVVVVRSLGPEEFIRNGENGLLTEPTAKSICDGIIALAHNAALLQKIKEKATETVEAYSPERVLQKFYSLLEDTGKGV